MLNLIFSRRYSMAHRLITGCSTKCATPHGHNEVATVRLAPIAPQPLDRNANMVEEFARAKATWHHWIDHHVDHAFQLSDRDPLIGFFQNSEPDKVSRLLVTAGDPTTEMLAVCFMSKLNAFLRHDRSGLICIEVAIEETPTNTVIFNGIPTHHLGSNPAWWNRPDYSINDL